MLLYLDLDTSTLITSPGYATAVTQLTTKRGDGEMVRIQLLRNGQSWQAPTLAELKYGVKKSGDWDDAAPVLALATGFVWMPETRAYEAPCNYNTVALLALMQAGAAEGADRIIELMVEVNYRPTSAATWQRSVNTPSLTIYNNVLRGIETIPGGAVTTELLPDNYLPRDRVTEYLRTHTGLTGGGAANLDGLATVTSSGRTVGDLVSLVDNTAGVDFYRVYELTSGTTAEAAPGVIRPDDYHATTNAKVWRLRSSVSNVDGTLMATKDASIEYLRAVTGLTGGGATKLDGLPTAGQRAANHLVALIDTTAGADIHRIYELVAGTTAEAAPGVIKPDDYHAATNAVVWMLRTPKTTFDDAAYLPRTSTLEYIPGVIGLTGGGATKLDGVATFTRPVGSIVALIDDSASTPIMRHYELVAGTTAETAPSVIRPDDYNGSNNSKVWLLRLGSTSLSNVGNATNNITLETGNSIAGYGTLALAEGKVISQMVQNLNGGSGYTQAEWEMNFFQLVADNKVAALSEGRTADVIQPADYNNVSNARKWVRLHPGGFGKYKSLSLRQQGQVVNTVASLNGFPTAESVAVGIFPTVSVVTPGAAPTSNGGLATPGAIRFYKLRAGTGNSVAWEECFAAQVPVPQEDGELCRFYSAFTQVSDLAGILTAAKVAAGIFPLVSIMISGALRFYRLVAESTVPSELLSVSPQPSDYDADDNAVRWLRISIA